MQSRFSEFRLFKVLLRPIRCYALKIVSTFGAEFNCDECLCVHTCLSGITVLSSQHTSFHNFNGKLVLSWMTAKVLISWWCNFIVDILHSFCFRTTVYIDILIECFTVRVKYNLCIIHFYGTTAPLCQGFLIMQASRSTSDISHSVGLLWTSNQPDTGTSTWQYTSVTRENHPCLWWDSTP
jgi:hypothetical protein